MATLAGRYCCVILDIGVVAKTVGPRTNGSAEFEPEVIYQLLF